MPAVGLVVLVLLIVAARIGWRSHTGPNLTSEPPSGTIYQELLRNPILIDSNHDLEIIVHRDALEFGWRSRHLDQARALRLRLPFGHAVWSSIPPGDN